MKKIIISGMIGNALEWYDYALYAQFSYIIGKEFFPETEFVIILTYAVFAAGFIIRPLGGIMFGNIGDRFGRRTALVIGILMMAIPTAGIGLLPSYNCIGIAAPIILVIIRLIQGLSLGGEFSGCIAYLVEHSPEDQRGVIGSTSFVSMCLGMLLGLIVAQSFTYCLSTQDLLSWGWRIPFVSGLFIGFIGLYIRTHLSESPVYKAAKASGALSRRPLRDTLSLHWREVLVATGIYVNVTAPFYIATIYMKSYMSNLGYKMHHASIVSGIILITMSVAFPISAYVSDRVGRKPVLIFGLFALCISIYPTFYALHSMNYYVAILSQVIFSAIIGIYMGPVPTTLVELFPTKVRFTGVAISYNLSAALFGGTAPCIGELLSKLTGESIFIAYYLSVLAVLGFIVLKYYKETYRKNIEL